MGGTNPVIWFEIYVQDMARAKKFYEGVFQLKLEPLSDPNDSGMEMWSFAMKDGVVGAGGALVKMQGVPSSPGGTLIYFQCDDCAVEEARVKQFGGRVEKPKMSIGQYGNISLVHDTEGNMIGLHSM
jgi:predicted enzyme related to lactoylglutathione lyase